MPRGARMARSPEDAELFGHIAEAKTALNRALAVCNRTRGAGARVTSRRSAASAWQIRRLLRALDGIRGASPLFDETDPDLLPDEQRPLAGRSE